MNAKDKKYKVKPLMQEIEQTKQSEQTVFFRLNRPITEHEPQPQLIVNHLPRKKQPMISGQPQQKQHSQSEKKEQQNQLTNLFSGLNLKKSVQYFLKRVSDLPQAMHLIQPASLKHEKSNSLTQQTRSNNREQKFAKSRGIEPAIKIIDIEPQYVQLGGETHEVEELCPITSYYYVLSKRETIKAGPQISLPDHALQLLNHIQFEQQLSDRQSGMSEEDEDSNRESNPDYDYPEEDYHEGGDSDDEGIIGRDFYPGRSDDEEAGDSDAELDEEEVYRRYLRRCRNAEDDDSDYDQYQ